MDSAWEGPPIKGTISKALVLAPHPDDEINIAGQVIPRLLDAGVDCTICFSTNGDYYPWDAKLRYSEAMRAAAVLGVPSDHIWFLGYGDAFDGPHVYIDGADHVVTSKAGHASTYVARGLSFSEATTGTPSPYTRSAFIGDIAAAIERALPDLIICVDYDSHADHKALALAFEHAMARVLRAHRDWRPVVLKKFAYACSWEGPNDYWSFAPSVLPEHIADGWPFVLSNPAYSWEERVRLAPDARTLTPGLKRNLLWPASKAHRSQRAYLFTSKVCNSDVVYWLRRTDNLVLDARLSASSGSVEGIDGFTRVDIDDISDGFAVEQLAKRGWVPSTSDTERTLTVEFMKPQNVAEIRVTVCPRCEDFPAKLSVTLDGAVAVELTRVPKTCTYMASFEPRRCSKLALGPAPVLKDFSVEAVEVYDTPTDSCELLSRLHATLPEVADTDRTPEPPRSIPARKALLFAHRCTSALTERAVDQLRARAFRRKNR